MNIETRFKPNDIVYTWLATIEEKQVLCKVCDGRGELTKLDGSRFMCPCCSTGLSHVGIKIYEMIVERVVSRVRVTTYQSGKVKVVYALNGGSFIYHESGDREPDRMIFGSEEEANEYKNKMVCQ